MYARVLVKSVRCAPRNVGGIGLQPTTGTVHETTQRPQAYGISSTASRTLQRAGESGGGSGGAGDVRPCGKARRSPKEQELLRADTLARQEYRAKMHQLRLEFQKETREKQDTDAKKVRLEYARIQKEKTALKEVKRQRALEGIARAEKRAKAAKERYEAGWRECWRILDERAERRSQHHAILLEELEWESQFWITSEEGIAEKINDRLWDNPGASTAGGEISMPDEHLWRFAPNVGLEGADEEPSELQGYLRMQMMERMNAMRAAKGYVQERKKRWSNDTRGLIQEADRVVRKGGAPKGWLERKQQSRAAGRNSKPTSFRLKCTKK